MKASSLPRVACATALFFCLSVTAFAAELERVMPPLDTLAAAVCSNACSAPAMPFHGAVLLTACQDALKSAGGLDALTQLASKSKEFSDEAQGALSALGVSGGIPALQHALDDPAKQRQLSCGAGVLFTAMAGARKESPGVKISDFSCIHGGLTDGGCLFTDEQITAHADSRLLFRSGLDRALASFYDRVDAATLGKKLNASVTTPQAALEYLSDVQSGSLPRQMTRILKWGREHPTDVLEFGVPSPAQK